MPEHSIKNKKLLRAILSPAIFIQGRPTFSLADALAGRVNPLTGTIEPRKWKRKKALKSECPRCGARTRKGTLCEMRVYVRPDGTQARRCRLHGGLSTGPKSKEGREAIAAANRARAKRGEPVKTGKKAAC